MAPWHFRKTQSAATAEPEAPNGQQQGTPDTQAARPSSTGQNPVQPGAEQIGPTGTPQGHDRHYSEGQLRPATGPPSSFHTYSSMPGNQPGAPFYGPITDPAAYEQWQLDYALAMSYNEHAARQQPAPGGGWTQQAPPTAVGITAVKRDVSTKGQAEALSYKYWATGR